MTVKELIKILNSMIKKDKSCEDLKVCVTDTDWWTYEAGEVEMKNTYVSSELETEEVVVIL